MPIVLISCALLIAITTVIHYEMLRILNPDYPLGGSSSLRERALQQAFEREHRVVNCSIGCVTFQEPLPGVEDAVRAADMLMYQVKRQGKNAVAFEVFA